MCSKCSSWITPWICGYCKGRWVYPPRDHTMCTVCQGNGGIKSDNTCPKCDNGKINCTLCDGDEQIKTSGPCIAHTITGSHYYCTSSSHHGNNVSQYHK